MQLWQKSLYSTQHIAISRAVGLRGLLAVFTKIPVFSDIMERDAVSIGRSQSICICNTNVIMRPCPQFSCHFATVETFKIKNVECQQLNILYVKVTGKGKFQVLLLVSCQWHELRMCSLASFRTNIWREKVNATINSVIRVKFCDMCRSVYFRFSWYIR